MEQQQIAFLGSLLAPPISVNGAACIMTHKPPQPVQPVLSHSPAEPAPAPVALPPQPSPPLESPLDTAEAAVNLGQSLLKRELLVTRNGALQNGQVPSWTGLGFDMRQRCIELMDAALVCSITDKYAREARAEEEAQKHVTSLYQKSCTCARKNAATSTVAALCRDKAALGSVYDSIVAGLRLPRPGVQPCSAAAAMQPHQLNGWPRKRQHCADDSQATDTSFPAACGKAADPEQPDSPTRDAADPTPAAPGASPAGREEQAAATLFTLADLAGSEDEQMETGSPPHLAPLLKPSQQPQQQRQAGRGMRRVAGQPKLPFKQVLLVQTGSGQDQHATRATTAAIRACRDVSQSSCLPALRKMVPSGYHGLKVSVRIGVPDPGSVDVSEVRQVFPHGRVAVEVVDGGLRAPPALENGQQKGTWYIAVATVTIGY